MKFVYCPHDKVTMNSETKYSVPRNSSIIFDGVTSGPILKHIIKTLHMYYNVAGMSCRSRAVAIKGVHCILAGVHTTLAKCSYQPSTKHHSSLKNYKEAVNIKSTLHIFENVASLLYHELGFPSQRI